MFRTYMMLLRSMSAVLALVGLAAFAGCTSGEDTADSASDLSHHPAGSHGLPPIKTVFVIVLENHNWSDIKGSPSAPYMNGTLLTEGAHAENYVNVPGIHPSEPNYIWLEAGDNLGIKTDADPSATHSIPTGTDHLTAQLERANKTWRSYQEDMPAGTCPTKSEGLYAAKHNPMVFFQDVSGSPPSKTNANCMEHVRPLTELASDLSSGHAADYNFLTPNLCNNSHGATGCPSDLIKASDDWLAHIIPQIQASSQYKAGGAIFITYDESEHGDHPIPMIALSPFAAAGRASTVKFTHSSTLRTIEDIFGLPPLRDAANATNLADLFTVHGGGSSSSSSTGGSGGGGVGPDGHSRPDPNLTPGDVFPNADKATICQSGYPATVRHLTTSEKAAVAASYNFTGTNSSVEYDHLVSLELGGSNDAKNIWPEPIADAHVKDGLEDYLHVKVCDGSLDLAEVQKRIASDWVKLWNDVGQPGPNHPGAEHPQLP